jgi:hypothetical protein
VECARYFKYHVAILGASEIDRTESRTGNIARLGGSNRRAAARADETPPRAAECLSGGVILEVFP